MDIQEDLQLREVHIDPVERFRDEYVGTATELRGLFKIPETNASVRVNCRNCFEN